MHIRTRSWPRAMTRWNAIKSNHCNLYGLERHSQLREWRIRSTMGRGWRRRHTQNGNSKTSQRHRARDWFSRFICQWLLSARLCAPTNVVEMSKYFRFFWFSIASSRSPAQRSWLFFSFSIYIGCVRCNVQCAATAGYWPHSGYGVVKRIPHASLTLALISLRGARTKPLSSWTFGNRRNEITVSAAWTLESQCESFRHSAQLRYAPLSPMFAPHSRNEWMKETDSHWLFSHPWRARRFGCCGGDRSNSIIECLDSAQRMSTASLCPLVASTFFLSAFGHIGLDHRLPPSINQPPVSFKAVWHSFQRQFTTVCTIYRVISRSLSHICRHTICLCSILWHAATDADFCDRYTM